MPLFLPFTAFGLLRPMSAAGLGSLPDTAAVYFDEAGATHVVLEPDEVRGVPSDSFRDVSRKPLWALAWGPSAVNRVFNAVSAVKSRDISLAGPETTKYSSAGGIQAAKDDKSQPVSAPTDPTPEPPKLLRFEEEAVQAFHRIKMAQQAMPEEFFDRVLLGRSYRHFRQYAEAEAIFLNLLAMPGLNDRQRARALSERAVTLREAGEVDLALDVIDTALALKETNPHYHCERGILLRLKKDYPGALAALDRAERLDPTKPRFLVEIGVTLGEIGARRSENKKTQRAQRTFAEAMECLEDAMEMSPLRRPRHYVELAVLLRRMGKFSQALDAHQRSLALDDTHPRHFLELAATFVAQKRYPEARDAQKAAAVLEERWCRLSSFVMTGR